LTPDIGVFSAKYMPQLQHNMWVVASRNAVLSVITGGGKSVEITTHADPLYQHLIVTAERKFWRCVENGEPPRLFCVEPPKPRIEAVRIVDMSASNSWAEFAGLFRSTRQAFLDHERSKAELKTLMPEDAKEAIGHGISAKRSKSGAVALFTLVGIAGEDDLDAPDLIVTPPSKAERARGNQNGQRSRGQVHSPPQFSTGRRMKTVSNPPRAVFAMATALMASSASRASARAFAGIAAIVSRLGMNSDEEENSTGSTSLGEMSTRIPIGTLSNTFSAKS
jgi:hypothetical protein